ncbi:hypothetical protein SDC9_195921 [bioreactor metagenome]|uniref:Uncharacterized protein n=1 Tax=bioreactor metagenome TaxID=1076179 RepID=A0A645IJ33_9ZZZZ
MPDYKSMYFKLFNKVTDAICILQKAQADGEDEYIESKDKPILISLETSSNDLFNKDKDQE